MLFPTLDFGIFFCIVFVLAHATENYPWLRKLVLLIASYVFYAFWDWRFCFLLFGDSMVAYFAGLALLRVKDRRARKWIVGIATAIILGVLGVFKYYGFFITSLSDLLAWAGIERDLVFLEILLPVGISFFSFHAISYIVDVYRGDAEAERSPLDILLYISFFPQLVAGPIVRAAQFLPQLKRPPSITLAAASVALAMILSGLVKKMIVAQYLASELVDPVFLTPSLFDAGTLLLAAYAYAVQIYCDFSGYTDIAIGIAALFGYQFPQNFNQPYRAQSIQDFWRRWHMSLSSWLRDYLYKPLGGSRHGRLKTYCNLMITMVLGGLWHGAAWSFVIWGTLHGLALTLQRAASDLAERRGVHSHVPGVIAVLVTFHFVCASWIFFRASSLEVALDYFGGLASWGRTGEVLGRQPFILALILIPLALQFVDSDRLSQRVRAFAVSPIAVRAALFSVALIAIYLVAPEGTTPFIYFQF